MRLPVIAPWALRAIGVLLLAAGASVWLVSLRSERSGVKAQAHQLFEALGGEEAETAKDASALVTISQAPRVVRAALLREALSSEDAANKLRLHEQGLSVALSRVNYSDAVALYQEAILPALKADPGPKSLRECFALLSRWTLTEQVSPKDADEIASRLTSQLSAVSEEAQETATLDQYSAAIVELAPRVTPETASNLAAKLLARATTERDPDPQSDSQPGRPGAAAPSRDARKICFCTGGSPHDGARFVGVAGSGLRAWALERDPGIESRGRACRETLRTDHGRVR